MTACCSEIALHDPGGLGQGYEQGNVIAYRYDNEAIPDDERLQADLRTMLEMLMPSMPPTRKQPIPFRTFCERVLELQRSYSSDGNTPEMQLRGRLLKHDGPRALQPLLSDIPGLSYRPEVEGGDGSGRKARVPWILIFDRPRSERPPLRWYVAYLFAADGSAAYLSVNLGSAPSEDGKNRELPAAFRQECVSWARKILQLDWEVQQMALHDPGGLGPFWEQGSVVAVPLRQRGHSR